MGADGGQRDAQREDLVLCCSGWIVVRLDGGVRPCGGHTKETFRGVVMVIRVGVNGFGRVGRNFFRAVDV